MQSLQFGYEDPYCPFAQAGDGEGLVEVEIDEEEGEGDGNGNGDGDGSGDDGTGAGDGEMVDDGDGGKATHRSTAKLASLLISPFHIFPLGHD